MIEVLCLYFVHDRDYISDVLCLICMFIIVQNNNSYKKRRISESIYIVCVIFCKSATVKGVETETVLKL